MKYLYYAPFILLIADPFLAGPHVSRQVASQRKHVASASQPTHTFRLLLSRTMDCRCASIFSPPSIIPCSYATVPGICLLQSQTPTAVSYLVMFRQTCLSSKGNFKSGTYVQRPIISTLSDELNKAYRSMVTICQNGNILR